MLKVINSKKMDRINSELARNKKELTKLRLENDNLRDTLKCKNIKVVELTNSYDTLKLVKTIITSNDYNNKENTLNKVKDLLRNF